MISWASLMTTTGSRRIGSGTQTTPSLALRLWELRQVSVSRSLKYLKPSGSGSFIQSTQYSPIRTWINLKNLPSICNERDSAFAGRHGQNLIQGGFRSLLTDPVGGRLRGSGDMELTLATRLAGWKICVEPRLRLKHFLPAERLRCEYLRRLQRASSTSQALLDAFSDQTLSMRLGLKRRLRQPWWCQAGRSMLKLLWRSNAESPRLLRTANTDTM